MQPLLCFGRSRQQDQTVCVCCQFVLYGDSPTCAQGRNRADKSQINYAAKLLGVLLQCFQVRAGYHFAALL